MLSKVPLSLSLSLSLSAPSPRFDKVEFLQELNNAIRLNRLSANSQEKFYMNYSIVKLTSTLFLFIY